MMEEIPILKFNSPKNMYGVEDEIKEMIEHGAPFVVINVQLQKLKKYSYTSFIETNLKMFSSDPKKYHKALQNLM